MECDGNQAVSECVSPRETCPEELLRLSDPCCFAETFVMEGQPTGRNLRASTHLL